MNIKIISSSIREGRKSHYVALFINQWLKDNTDAKSEIIDLKALDFPLFHERLKYLENPDEKIVQFGKDIEDADAIFIVSPEYNGSFPASLKNVIDLLYSEWQHKPISLALASAGNFAGMHVAKDLGFLIYRIGALLTKSRFHVGNVGDNFNEKGELLNNEELYKKNIQRCYDELEDFYKKNQ